MRARCPTCGGVGSVPKAFPDGTVMCYCGPNGEGWPQEFCQTCAGSGWVTMQVVPAEPEQNWRVICGEMYQVLPGKPPEITSTGVPQVFETRTTWVESEFTFNQSTW